MSFREERLMFEPRETVGLELSVQQSHIAVKSLHQVQRALACVRKETHAGKAADFDSLTSSFREAEDGVESLSRLFSALDPIFYNVYQTPKSAAVVQKTFDTAELLEMILLNLSPCSLLEAQRTNWQFFEVIEGSSKVQRKMMLERSGSQTFSTFLPIGGYGGHVFHGLSYHIRPPGVHNMWRQDETSKAFYSGTPIVNMDIISQIDPSPSARIGARCLKILLCEPVITSLTVYPDCCGALGDSEYFILSNSDEQDSVHEISNPNGITIGDIYEAARLVKEHPECCFRGVKFRGSISVRSSDPVVRRYLDSHHVESYQADSASSNDERNQSLAGSNFSHVDNEDAEQGEGENRSV